MAVVKIGKGVVNALVDTGGARCMVDVNTAKKLGLSIEVAGTGSRFGSFTGPNGATVPYYGKIKGPVRLDVGPEVYLEVPDIKVIVHPSNMLILGTDVLVQSWNEWRFRHVGIHDETQVGFWSLMRRDGTVANIELSSWPAPVDENGVRR